MRVVDVQDVHGTVSMSMYPTAKKLVISKNGSHRKRETFETDSLFFPFHDQTVQTNNNALIRETVNAMNKLAIGRRRRAVATSRLNNRKKCASLLLQGFQKALHEWKSGPQVLVI
jgi:hypothetical protein